MWRRVSCEQPLNTSQSILRLRGSLVQLFGDFLLLRNQNAAERESGPYSRTWLRNRFRTLTDSVVATRHDRETPTGTLGRVVFSA